MKRILFAAVILFSSIFSSLPAFAGVAPGVELFSPQGTVKGVRQVSVRFSEQMMPLGDPRSLADPFDIACKASGSGRWADGKNWLYDFNEDLPAGISCTFTLKPQIKTLEGQALAGRRVFNFSTGGPAIIGTMPYDGNTINEDQIIILTLDAQPDIQSVLKNAVFSVEGIADAIGVDLIEGKDREKILKASGYRQDIQTDASRLLLLKSRQRFPNETNVRLIWGKGIKSLTGIETTQNQIFSYSTRKEFIATFSCSRENPQADCIPLLPMMINFTAPLSSKQAKNIVLKEAVTNAPPQPAGKNKQPVHSPNARIWKAGLEQDEDYVYSVVFKGPFPENAKFIIEMPAGMQDDAGRKLVNAKSFPLPVRTGVNPPLAKFSGRFGILESKTDAPLPVTVRNLEPSLKLSTLNPAGDLAGRTAGIKTDQGKGLQTWLRQVASATRTKSVFTTGVKSRQFSLPKPNETKAFEVIGIPLSGPGFYVVELESRILGKSLLGTEKPLYVQTAALVTNLAAHFKQGRESSLVWVTTLDRAQTVEGADVVIRDCRDKIIWRGKTNASGIASIRRKLPGANELPYCPFKEDEDHNYQYDESYQLAGLQGGLFITAQSGADLTFVHSSWDQGIETWRFGLPEEDYQAPTIAHTVFDRTLLRAGDTLHMKHILREHTQAGFSYAPQSKRPSKASITHSGSEQKYEFPLKWDAKGVAQTTWTIPKEAKLGRYEISLGEYVSGGFRVEEYRVPLMRGLLQPPVLPLIQAREAMLDAGVQYLSGGGAGNLPIKIRAEIRPKYVAAFAGYEDFTFANGQVATGLTRRGDYNPEDATETDNTKNVKLPSRNLVLGPEGSLRFTIEGLTQANIPRELHSEMEFADPNGEISTISSRVALWPSKYLIGIKPDSWATSKEALKFQVAVVDISGKPVTGVNVQVDILERKNYSHRKRLIGGFYAYEHITETKNIGAICQGKTGERGLLLCETKSPVSGNVILQAQSADEAGYKTTANRDIWIAGKEDWWFDVSDSDRIDLLAEKKRYEPGDKAVFQIRMPFREATALVSVEREGILDAWVTPVSGKNPVIEAPIKNNYAPNVYVSALVVRGRTPGILPTSMVDLGKPAYKLGIAEIAVGWKNHELKLTVETDKKVYKIREKALVKIKASTATGQKLPAGAELAVAVVDEGLLELLPNSSWDLLISMMGRRGIGVKTATAQMQVVGKRHFGLKALAPGGGGGLASGHGPSREMFDPVILWKGRVILDEQGEATLEAPLNDSMTSFRIAAVATAGTGHFGTGYATIRSTQDLMILPGLSPVIRQGDTFFAPFTVRNTTLRDMEVQLSAAVAGLPAKLSPLNLSLAAGVAKEAGWTVTAPVGQNSLDWTVSVKDLQNNVADKIKISQKAAEATPVRTYQSTITQLAGNYRLEVKRPSDALPGLGGVKTTLKSKLSDGLDGVADYMKNYPYTCIEQKISQAVALRDDQLWKETTAKLPAHLDSSGLVKFFPIPWLCGSPTLTAYIVAIANEAGLSIPEDALQKMENGLTQFIEGKYTCASSFSAADLSIRKISAIEALSRNGKASAAMLGSISIDPNLWPTSAVIDWRNILRNIEDIPNREARIKEALQILRSRLNFQGTTMGFSTEKSDFLWWLMVSVDVNAVRAMLALQNEPSWKDDIPRMARGALARQKRGHWDLTSANAWGVLAMEKFSKTFEAEPVGGRTVTTLNQDTKTLDWQKNPQGKSELFGWPREQSPISVSHEGTGKPWLTVAGMAAIPLKKPFSSGYKITKSITAVAQKTPKRWTKGDVLRVRLDLEAQADQTWVVVNDPVPAGATILGGGLGRDSQILTSGEKKAGDVWPAFEERSLEAFRAYYEFVPKGKWRVEYTLRLNQSGTFNLPATRVEAMYYPEMLGEIPNETVRVGN